MKKQLSKTEVEKEIKEFFDNVKYKTPKEIKKIKKLAQSHNIKIKEKRKIFCRKCLNPFSGKENIKIKNKIKITTCLNCKNISRWKIKLS